MPPPPDSIRSNRPIKVCLDVIRDDMLANKQTTVDAQERAWWMSAWCRKADPGLGSYYLGRNWDKMLAR